MCQNSQKRKFGHDTLFISMRVLFVGGGTGGHFYPLIATAEAIKEKRVSNLELFYIGPEPYNQSELDRLNIKFIYCPAGKIRRYFSVKNILDAFRTLAGILFAFYKIFIIYPDVIFSKGSYTSFPVLLMARFYRIPVVIHESDSKPGRANIFARKFARYIGITYKDTLAYFDPKKTALVGIPIRRAVLSSFTDPFAVLGIRRDLPLIYVTGGSLGAERINALILSALHRLLPNYQIFHQTGEAQEATVIQSSQALVKDTELLSRYYVKGTIPGEAVSALLDASSLIITRAGSTTLYEIALHQKPAIIIPIPEEVSHDQRTNAYSYARGGGASVLEENNLTPNLLIGEIQSIMEDRAKYEKMQQGTKEFAKSNSAHLIADKLIEIGIEHGS